MTLRASQTGVRPSTGPMAQARYGLRFLCQIGLVLVMITIVMSGFFFTNYHQQSLIDLREGGRQMRIAQEALMDANAYVLSTALGDKRSDFADYSMAVEALHSRRETQLRLIDRFLTAANNGADLSAEALLRTLESNWAETLKLAYSGRLTEAQALIETSGSIEIVNKMRIAFGDFLTDWNSHFAFHETRIEIGKVVVLVSQIMIGVMMLFAFFTVARDGRARSVAIREMDASRMQVGHLLDMGDMLQSAGDHHDANSVLRTTASELIEGFAGALYVFNNSRDRLILSTSWGCGEAAALPDSITGNQCWAMKRGKHHINRQGPKALCCEHHQSSLVALEIPMSARGEHLGLLQLFAEGEDAEARLEAIRPLGSALGDAMSLALSNIALREKLRNQALRDPLTGLYNRRYMEDSLDRYVRLAEREGRKVSVIMIDLDHFKRLNDEHGHATGDAVLRETAAAIVSALRETDVACRYGGEELIVFLPDCDLEDARIKAEQIRANIEALSGTHGAQVSASLGVASVPMTSTNSTDLVKAADAALYRAKHAGRNQVALAPIRQGWRSSADEDADRGTVYSIAAE